MPSLSTRHFATEHGTKLLRSVEARVARALRMPGEGEVHDLRVAIRRASRTLSVLKDCFPRGESRRIRRGLKRILHQAGDVRDCDIAMKLAEKLALPGSGELVEELRDLRAKAAGALTGALQHWKDRKLVPVWMAALDSSEEKQFGAKPVVEMAKSLLPELVEEYFRHGEEVGKAGASPRNIHHFRIAAKNLRYTLDLFAPLYGDRLRGPLAELKDVQTVLGDLNDCVTVRRMVGREISGKDETVKALRNALKRRQHKKTEQFRETYAAGFSNKKTLRVWKDRLEGRSAKATVGRRRPS